MQENELTYVLWCERECVGVGGNILWCRVNTVTVVTFCVITGGERGIYCIYRLSFFHSFLVFGFCGFCSVVTIHIWPTN